MKNKFKVGDKVVVNYCSDKALMGKKGTVVEVNSYDCGIEFDEYISGHTCGRQAKFGYGWYVVNSGISRIENETIVIYRKDDKVYALDKATGKKVFAKCHPDDEFDFKKGAEIAFNRLMGKEPGKPKEEPKKEPYNGKVVCVKNTLGNEKAYTVGKIYQFKDGRFIDDRGNKTPDLFAKPCYSFAEWDDFSCSEWLEVVD